ncbi:hypothetical protein PJI16_03840 [Nitrospira sp. MA-1]|nr:hypothetical protein [Nitrospira sp. MA-1]
MNRYFTTKGLFLREIDSKRYVLEDIFGNCTLPIRADGIESASAKANKLCGVELLCHEATLDLSLNLPPFQWFELEKYYVSNLTDQFRYWQVGTTSVSTFDLLSRLLPNGYFHLGFGEGSREQLEEIDNMVHSAAKTGQVPFTSEYIAIRLSHIQLIRICSDLMSLMQRAINAFAELLAIQRATIKNEYWAAVQMDTPEIVHTGPSSYKAATSITYCVISLCTSLDISSKLVHFLNGCSRPILRFKNVQSKHFSDLSKMRATVLPMELVERVVARGKNERQFSSLTQLRHDLVHSTTILEMEKIFIGFQTGEVNELPLHYSHMPWRDCLVSGQPVRYLGRDYFTSKGVDIEWQLLAWILSVIDYHLFVGEALYKFMKSNSVDDVGVQLSVNPRS